MSHPRFNLDAMPGNYSVEYIETRVAGREITTCVIRNDDNEIIGQGSAICHHRDTPDPALGAAIASGRAVKNYYWSDEALKLDYKLIIGPSHAESI